MNLLYIWSRIIKKIRGSSIKNSRIHKTSKIEAGSQVINTFMDKYSFCGYDCKLLNCRIGKFTSVADWGNATPYKMGIDFSCVL